MITFWRAVALWVLCTTVSIGTGGMAVAQNPLQRMDDTGTQVLAGPIAMKWDQAVPRKGQTPTVSGTARVRVRLDTRPWQGRTVRIFLALPAQGFGEVTARWVASGPLLPGQLVSGQTPGGLVYSGMVAGPVLEDTLVLTMHADGTRLTRLEQLDFSFYVEAAQ